MKKKNRLNVILVWIIVLIIMFIFRYWYYTTKQDIIDYISQQTIVREIEKEQESIVVTVERDELSSTHYDSVKLDVSNITQKPELPTGCEITSLATTLNYLFPSNDVDKVQLSDMLLPKGNIGITNPAKAFIGNPRLELSYGCYAPVIVETANSYLEQLRVSGVKYNAYDITGTNFNDLLKYILDGYPVMVWETINMSETYISKTWNIDNEEVPWHANEHCMVLIGFNNNNHTYLMADPLKNGITEYDMDIVEQRYNQLGKQAVVIY